MRARRATREDAARPSNHPIFTVSPRGRGRPMSGDVLATPDLLSQGYGQIAKMIMADERMTCEAKCIYSLLASFSGGGCAPYPSVEYQLRKLHLSRQRYYRHRRF